MEKGVFVRFKKKMSGKTRCKHKYRAAMDFMYWLHAQLAKLWFNCWLIMEMLLQQPPAPPCINEDDLAPSSSGSTTTATTPNIKYKKVLVDINYIK